MRQAHLLDGIRSEAWRDARKLGHGRRRGVPQRAFERIAVQRPWRERGAAARVVVVARIRQSTRGVHLGATLRATDHTKPRESAPTVGGSGQVGIGVGGVGGVGGGRAEGQQRSEGGEADVASGVDGGVGLPLQRGVDSGVEGGGAVGIDGGRERGESLGQRGSVECVRSQALGLQTWQEGGGGGFE